MTNLYKTIVHIGTKYYVIFTRCQYLENRKRKIILYERNYNDIVHSVLHYNEIFVNISADLRLKANATKSNSQFKL